VLQRVAACCSVFELFCSVSRSHQFCTKSISSFHLFQHQHSNTFYTEGHVCVCGERRGGGQGYAKIPAIHPEIMLFYTPPPPPPPPPHPVLNPSEGASAGRISLKEELLLSTSSDSVCCSVLQCVAVCRSVLQCVAEFCSVLQCVAV